jgi:hypothetical protein
VIYLFYNIINRLQILKTGYPVISGQKDSILI